MRTKTLALMAAIGLMGSAVGFAQVYSQNAVGYYTLNLSGGFNLVANQLNNGDNNLNTIMPATTPLPDGTTALTWPPGGSTFNAVSDTFFAGFGWFDPDLNPSTTTLSPGQGAFLQCASAADIVLVGDVPQGTGPDALTQDLVPGFQIVSQLTPQAVGVDATGFPAADGDSIQFWNPALGASGAYDPARTYAYFAGFGWVDEDLNIVDPVPAIGEAFFYERSGAGGNATWTREFSVNP
jgi:hypothetical protein